MYTASIHDPVSGAPITIKAHNESTLCLKVDLKIDELRKAVVELLLPASAAASLIIFSYIVAVDLTPFGVIVITLLTVAYLRGAPHWVNPLAHICYLRKCMHAWEQELERISAPDTRTV